jgi:hypothetical protein
VTARREVCAPAGDRGDERGDDEEHDRSSPTTASMRLLTPLAKAVVRVDSVVEEHPEGL